MIIDELRIVGIRCFVDTGYIQFSPTCNVVVGTNNAGKSTILRSILLYQGSHFSDEDMRRDAPLCYTALFLSDIQKDIILHANFANARPVALQALHSYRGSLDGVAKPGTFAHNISNGATFFSPTRPHHALVPLIARRKAAEYNHSVTTNVQREVTGTFSNLYSRIDELATYGHPKHQMFIQAVSDIVGLPICTRSSGNGKEAGYFQGDNFISLERMGDGVSEMLGLIVELCTADKRVFVLEEPETNLHPSGLKALLRLVRLASAKNQFIIATHSNIVVRELAAAQDAKVFHVRSNATSRESTVEEVGNDAGARLNLLRDLGYDFADFDLHEAWLLLEESSAERVINDILIPTFASGLRGKLRTFAAGGITKVEPGVEEFQRLLTFLHLEPIYKTRMWLRVDGDDKGRNVVTSLRQKFKHLTEERCNTFKHSHFEWYYPEAFRKDADVALAISDKNDRRRAKLALLQAVLEWTRNEGHAAAAAWEQSAFEVISFLRGVENALRPGAGDHSSQSDL